MSRTTWRLPLCSEGTSTRIIRVQVGYGKRLCRRAKTVAIACGGRSGPLIHQMRGDGAERATLNMAKNNKGFHLMKRSSLGLEEITSGDGGGAGKACSRANRRGTAKVGSHKRPELPTKGAVSGIEVLYCPRRQARGKSHVPLSLLLSADGDLPLKFPIQRVTAGFRLIEIGLGLRS